MPIRFKCPSCNKALAVKEQMAGKKAACPACKKPLLIPAPVSKPPDVEDLAANLFSDPPPAKAEEKPKSTQTIDFICPFCDAELHLSAELSGKREPCPECKNIIKVPLLVKEQAKDWRTVESGGPSGAAVKGQPQLEGAWGSTTHKGKVSMKSLEEADAIIYEDDEEPGGVGRWIKRITILAAVGGLIFLAIWSLNRRKSSRDQKDAIGRALKYVEEAKDKDRLPPTWNAEIYRAAGEFFTAKKEKPSFDLAQKYFKVARNLLKAEDKNALDIDLSVPRLALTQIEMAGTQSEVDFDKVRLDWSDVNEEMFKSLQKIGSTEAKVWALRALADKLVAKKQGFRATGFAGRLAKDDEPALVAQWFAFVFDPNMKTDQFKTLKEQADKKIPPPAPNRILDVFTRTAYAEKLARENNFPEALKLIQAPGKPQDQMRAALAVANVARDKPPAESGLDLALKLADDLKDNVPPWLRLQLVQAAVRAGMLDQANEVAKKLPADFKGWGELEVFQGLLSKNQGLAEAKLVEDIGDKDSLPRALAWEAWARHNTRLGFKDEVDSAWDKSETRLRPFIDVGIALGVQGK